MDTGRASVVERTNNRRYAGVHLEALSVGFVLAMVAAVTLGFLEIVVPVDGTGWIVYGVGMAGWAVGVQVRSR